MEELLSFLWQERLSEHEELTDLSGQRFGILSQGSLRKNIPHCYEGASLAIPGGSPREGYLLILFRLSLWREWQDRYPELDEETILIVAAHNDDTPLRYDGSPIPSFLLPIPEQLSENYCFLLEADRFMPCMGRTGSISELTLQDWLGALAVERFQKKAIRIERWLSQYKGSWEEVAYVAFVRMLGFGKDNEAFEALAHKVPLSLLQRVSEDLFSAEALLFGQAGLLNPEMGEGAYFYDLQEEYEFLRSKFTLVPLNPEVWLISRFGIHEAPHRRIALIAEMTHRGFRLFQQICCAAETDSFEGLFNFQLSGYWRDHDLFEETAQCIAPSLGAGARHLFLINTVAPLLYSYGKRYANETFVVQAFSLWEELNAEHNRIVQAYKGIGIEAKSALESQALIQLYSVYCAPKTCLHCRFGALALRYPH